MRIRPSVFGILVLVIFMGTIWGFQLAGVWSISGKVTASGQAVQPLAEDVNSIKGWMTLGQIAQVYNVSLEEIIGQFNLPAGTEAGTAIKDLESDSFEVTDLKTWLQERSQVEPTALPVTQAAVTPTEPVVSTPTAVAESAAATAAATAAPTEHLAVVRQVTGKTTFQDLLDWGVPVDAIQTVIGAEIPAPATVIKDYVTANGLEFGTVKAALQVEGDKTK